MSSFSHRGLENELRRQALRRRFDKLVSATPDEPFLNRDTLAAIGQLGNVRDDPRFTQVLIREMALPAKTPEVTVVVGELDPQVAASLSFSVLQELVTERVLAAIPSDERSFDEVAVGLLNLAGATEITRDGFRDRRVGRMVLTQLQARGSGIWDRIPID